MGVGVGFTPNPAWQNLDRQELCASEPFNKLQSPPWNCASEAPSIPFRRRRIWGPGLSPAERWQRYHKGQLREPARVFSTGDGGQS